MPHAHTITPPPPALPPQLPPPSSYNTTVVSLLTVPRQTNAGGGVTLTGTVYIYIRITAHRTRCKQTTGTPFHCASGQRAAKICARRPHYMYRYKPVSSYSLRTSSRRKERVRNNKPWTDSARHLYLMLPTSTAPAQTPGRQYYIHRRFGTQKCWKNTIAYIIGSQTKQYSEHVHLLFKTRIKKACVRVWGRGG